MPIEPITFSDIINFSKRPRRLLYSNKNLEKITTVLDERMRKQGASHTAVTINLFPDCNHDNAPNIHFRSFPTIEKVLSDDRGEREYREEGVLRRIYVPFIDPHLTTLFLQLCYCSFVEFSRICSSGIFSLKVIHRL